MSSVQVFCLAVDLLADVRRQLAPRLSGVRLEKRRRAAQKIGSLLRQLGFLQVVEVLLDQQLICAALPARVEACIDTARLPELVALAGDKVTLDQCIRVMTTTLHAQNVTPPPASHANARTKKPGSAGLCFKRMMGLEPTTFCMASRRSSQLSYIRVRASVPQASASRASFTSLSASSLWARRTAV